MPGAADSVLLRGDEFSFGCESQRVSVMGQMKFARVAFCCVGFTFLTLQPWALGAQERRNDEKIQIGNGAILRRLFGDGEPKPAKEKARTTPQDALTATRERITSDAEKLKEKLGIKDSPNRPDGDAVSKPVGNRNANRANSNVKPNSAFAPQAANRSPAATPNRNKTNATPTAGTTRPKAVASADKLPRVPITKPSTSANPPIQVPRLELSDDVPEPKNQPRVPAEPTYASPPRPLPSSIEETEERRPPQPATFGAFGIIVDSDETSGLLIKSVKPKSLAAHIGLRSGDLIKNVAGLDVSVVEEIDSLVEVLEPEDEFEITFVRDRKSQTQAFSIPAK